MIDKTNTPNPRKRPARLLSIAAVERDTGLSKEALRMWERRYGFPAPERDEQGERMYPETQVARLRVIKRLMDLGHRPGKLVALGASELKKLADALPALKSDTPASSGTDGPDAEALQRLLECVIGHRPDDLRAQLVQAQHQRGLASLVTDLVAPLTEAVGNAWARGEITVGDEHLYAETVQLVLLPAVASLHPPPHRPRVLLTTAPQEGHGIGLLMAQTILALEGAYTLSLGLQTPLPDIVHMAEALQADIVALSFSIAANGRQAIATLQELRRSLPPQTDLWAGGACRDIHRRTPKGVAALRELEEIAPALTAWRQQHGL